MNVNSMTLEELRAVPPGRATQGTRVNSIIILPGEADAVHESGYREMAFILCWDGRPVCRIGRYSDVLHLEGTSGFGKDWLRKYGGVPTMVPPTGWAIDCLRESGLIRLFPSSDLCERIDVTDVPLSSFGIYGVLRADRDPRRAQQKNASTNSHCMLEKVS